MNELKQPPVDEHWGPFQYFAMVNKAVGRALLYRPFCTCEGRPAGWISRSEIAGSKGVQSSYFDCFCEPDPCGGCAGHGSTGKVCEGGLALVLSRAPLSTIGACIKQGHTRISKSKTCFIHVGIPQRQVPGQRNSFESPLSLVQTAEPGSRVTCGWPSISCFPVHPPKPGLWNKVLGACHLLVQNGLIPSCWQEKDSKWIFALVVLNNWRPTSWRSRWGGKKQETGERQVQMPPLCPGP